MRALRLSHSKEHGRLSGLLEEEVTGEELHKNEFSIFTRHLIFGPSDQG